MTSVTSRLTVALRLKVIVFRIVVVLVITITIITEIIIAGMVTV